MEYVIIYKWLIHIPSCDHSLDHVCTSVKCQHLCKYCSNNIPCSIQVKVCTNFYFAAGNLVTHMRMKLVALVNTSQSYSQAMAQTRNVSCHKAMPPTLTASSVNGTYMYPRTMWVCCHQIQGLMALLFLEWIVISLFIYLSLINLFRMCFVHCDIY